MITLLEDATQNGSFYLSHFGGKYALGFQPKCDPDFMERCLNLCYNRGIIGTDAKMRYPYGGSRSFGYIVTDSEQRILKGFASQIRSEMIMNGEVKPVVDEIDEETEEIRLEFDDAAIDIEAFTRAEQFMKQHVKIDHFMMEIGEERQEIAQVWGHAEMVGVGGE